MIIKQILPSVVVCALLLLGLAIQGFAEAPLLYGEPISIEHARKAALATIAEAKRNQWSIAVAIVDPGGDLVYFERIDGTQTGSLDMAIEKAKTSVSFKRPTRELEERIVAGRLQYLRQSGAIPIEGGEPIILDGKLVGGLGVSGVRSHQDGVCAKAGVSALMAVAK
jgi:uncharacterized protein GlcG (DUF336 family)